MTDFVAPVFTELIWLLAGGLFAVVLAVYLLLQASRAQRVHPGLWGLPHALVLVSLIAAGVAGLYNPDLWTGALAAVLMRWLGALVLLPLSGSMLLVLGFIAAREAPRDRLLAAWVLAVVIAASVCTVVEGSVGGNAMFGYVRGCIYLAFGGLVAVAAVGRSGIRAEAAQMASLVFPALVGSIEAAERALVAMMVLRHASRPETADQRAEAVQVMLQLTAGEQPWGIAAVGLAMLVPLTVFGVHQLRSRDRSALLALWVLALMPAILWVGLPDSVGIVAAIEAGRAP